VGYRWRFDVAKNFALSGSADAATLEFSGLENVPAGLEMNLRDLRLNRVIDLRQDQQYSFFLGEKDYVSGDVARFVLLVGGDEYVRSQRDGTEAPTQTRLLQNYPNPFRAGSVIRYEMAKAGTAELRVFDVRGQLVKRIVSEHSQPGRYEVAWHGRNEQGQSVPPGAYFYRLVAGKFSQSRKMILIR
jgi:hypothetical protein